MRKRLDSIEAKMLELLESSTVEVFDNDPGSGVVFIGAPKYYWGKRDHKQLRLQMELKKLYGEWYGSCNCFCRTRPGI